MRMITLLALISILLVGCGAKPDASVETRSQKEAGMMKQAGGDE
jgi:uncharacterized protein YcfL